MAQESYSSGHRLPCLPKVLFLLPFPPILSLALAILSLSLHLTHSYILSQSHSLYFPSSCHYSLNFHHSPSTSPCPVRLNLRLPYSHPNFPLPSPSLSPNFTLKSSRLVSVLPNMDVGCNVTLPHLHTGCPACPSKTSQVGAEDQNYSHSTATSTSFLSNPVLLPSSL